MFSSTRFSRNTPPICIAICLPFVSQHASHLYHSMPPIFGTKFDHDKDRNLQFRGAVSTGGSPLDFLLFLSSIHAQFSKTSPLKSGESREKSSGENRVKSCHVCGCHGFFGPETLKFKTNLQNEK